MSHAKLWPAAIICTGALLFADGPLRFGNVRQLFVDEFLIASKHNVSLNLHNPFAREILLRPERPWEGTTMTYPTVFRDGERFRLYYRASGPAVGTPLVVAPADKQMDWTYTATAESADGIHWTRPDLGVV